MVARLLTWLFCGSALVLPLLVWCSAGNCYEFITGLARCNTPQWHVSDSIDDARPAIGWLDEPTAKVPSPTALVEFNSENVLRSKRDGILTADVGFTTRTSSLFMPIKFRDLNTRIGLSQRLSHLSIFLNDSSETWTNLSWTGHEERWGINHKTGKFELGFTGFSKNGEMSGTSAYPQQVFKILNGDTSMVSAYKNNSVEAMLAISLVAHTQIRLAIGAQEMSSNLDLSKDDIQISLPANINMQTRSITLTSRLGKKLSSCANTSLITGDSGSRIYRSNQDSGKLTYDMDGRDYGLSLCYRLNTDSIVYGGMASRRGSLNLIGSSIRGQRLGIAIKPWNEKIDFNAKAAVTSDTYYIGYEHRASSRWTWNAIYRFSRLRQDVNADYFGRAFLGLVSVHGIYSDNLPDYNLHCIDLSTTYTRDKFSILLGLEQVVPQKIKTRKKEQPALPGAKTRSIGGTCFSIRFAYSL